MSFLVTLLLEDSGFKYSCMFSPAPRICYEMAFLRISTEYKQPTEFLKYLSLRTISRLPCAGTVSPLLPLT